MTNLEITTGVSHVLTGKGERISCEEYRLRRKTKSPGVRGKFLHGPVSIDWLKAAGSLPKCAVMVALCVSYQKGLEKKDRFRLKPSRLRELGIGRTSARRGLAALEQAGLVPVERHRGKAPVVGPIPNKIELAEIAPLA